MKKSTQRDGIIWNQHIPHNLLSPIEQRYISLWGNKKRPVLENIWAEMDNVWDSFQLDNKLSPAKQNIGQFYNHPIWVLNGLFTSFDPISCKHRTSIAKTIAALGVYRVADFGGGFGELARQISLIAPEIEMDVIEPFPSTIGQYQIDQIQQARLISGLEGKYDCLIAQDVLEHIEDPIKLVIELASATSNGGYLIFANCFKPVIKCHLPSTFHLRHTFRWVVEPLGLIFCGKVPGAEHVHIFQLKHRVVNPQAYRKRESISQKIDPWLNLACSLISTVYQFVVGKNR